VVEETATAVTAVHTVEGSSAVPRESVFGNTPAEVDGQSPGR